MTLLPDVLKGLAERLDGLYTLVRANHNSSAENINDLRRRVTELERYLPHLQNAAAGEITGAPYRVPSETNGPDPRMNLTIGDMGHVPGK